MNDKDENFIFTFLSYLLELSLPTFGYDFCWNRGDDVIGASWIGFYGRLRLGVCHAV